MNLRKKTVLIVVVMTILLVGTLHTISYTILLNSYGNLEDKEVTQTVAQINGEIMNEYSALSSKETDWSQWNDSFKFVQNNNSQFIADNLDPSSLKPFGVNFLLFFNSTGKLVYGIGINLDYGTKMPVPQSIQDLVSANPNLLHFPSTNSNITGLALLPEGPLIFSSQPILTTAGLGPSPGTLIFARYFDAGYLQTLSTTLRLHLNMTLYSSWDGASNGSYVSVPPYTYIRTTNANQVTGYYVMDDFNLRPALVLSTTLPRSTYDQGLYTLNYADLAVGVTAVGFCAAILFLMERAVLSRLHKLDRDVTTITREKNPAARLSFNGNDAISSLSGSINRMLEEIQKQTLRLRESERFTAIGELATMVAHDLRNPLQGIANATFYLQQNRSVDPKEQEMLSIIQEDVRYSDKIVNDLLDYSKNIRLEFSETDPGRLVKSSLSIVEIPPKVNLVDETEERPSIRVDADKLKRVFVNLIKNAIDAMPDGGTLLLKTREKVGAVEFSVSDTGIGMSKEVISKLFEPLFTTKAKGMGFGLAICKRIVEAHDGRITVDSTPGQGTTFTVSIPRDITPTGLGRAA